MFSSDPESTGPIVPAGYHLASFGRRAGGLAIDVVLINGPPMAAFYALGHDPFDTDPNLVWLSVAIIAVGLIYETLAVWRWGRTVGKWATGTRVVGMPDGAPLGLSRSFQRSLVPATVNAIPQVGVLLGIGVYTWAFFDPLRQGVHDKAAGSIVVQAHRAEVHEP